RSRGPSIRSSKRGVQRRTRIPPPVETGPSPAGAPAGTTLVRPAPCRHWAGAVRRARSPRAVRTRPQVATMRFLSQCIGLPVRDPSGEPIGTIADLIVAIGDRYPPVTGLVARTDRRQIFLPWLSVLSLADDGAPPHGPTTANTQFQHRPHDSPRNAG